MDLCVQGMEQPESKSPSLSSFTASQSELHLLRPARAAHMAKLLSPGLCCHQGSAVSCQQWCPIPSGVAAQQWLLPVPSSVTHPGSAFRQQWQLLEPKKESCRSLPGQERPLCSPWEASVLPCSWCNWVGCVSQQPYPSQRLCCRFMLS